VKRALVEVYYLGGTSEKVFSKEVESSASASFTPQKVGSYEVRVTVGVDQASSRFSVPLCSERTVNVTQVTTVRLSPERALLLSKTVGYPNGFVKKFEVWRERNNGAESYTTEITLTYSANQSFGNATVLDGVPKSVLASADQISFSKKPSRYGSAYGVDFEWDVKPLSSGQRLSYFYSFARPLTEQMIDSFPAPRLLYGQGAAREEQGSLLAASLVIAGIMVPLYALVGAGLLLLLVAVFLVFGRKRED
jgi:hypothetical protein